MKTLKVLSAAAVSVVMASCAVEKSETPLAPTVAGPIAGVQITAPKTLEPAAGAQIPGDKQPLTLLLENASSNGQRPLSYLFEIATEPGFNNRVFAQDNVPPGDGWPHVAETAVEPHDGQGVLLAREGARRSE